MDNNVKNQNDVTEKLEDIVDFVFDIEEDREIKILQLTDTQIIDAAQCRYTERIDDESKRRWATDRMYENAFKYMRYAVEKAKPDLIVFTGDNVYGEFDDSGSSLEKFINEVDGYEIPWCAVFGNHDNETLIGIDRTVALYESAKYSMFARGKVEGNSNYSVAVRANGKLKNVLFMIDTNGCTHAPTNEVGIYTFGGIYDGQVKWFENVNERLAALNGKPVPNAVFGHISVKAFADGLSMHHGYVSTNHGYLDGGDPESSKFKAIKIDGVDDRGDFGSMNADFGGMIDGEYKFVNIAKRYGTVGFFFGHDHTNNISVLHDGIRYTYGTKTGVYDFNLSSMLGGTLICLDGFALRVSHIYYSE